ncbi:polysaccharide deacetylase family protein [Agrococcus sp. Ld7]|uniref:polysaccharide deacetylase family protein n=1 Tax=Agrococcus sp. Ld7 TaxID=649148 RepID=UPI00386A408B
MLSRAATTARHDTRINLCFHGIGTDPTERERGESRYWVTETLFLRVLDRVGPMPWVSLSFDDGNLSDADIALPALRERGLTATFFVLAGRLHDPASLSSLHLRTLAAAGMRIGTHGWDHRSWRNLTDAAARRELIDARATLSEASGTDITEAALPMGQYDRATLARLRAASYSAVYTSDRYPARDQSWLRPRYSVAADDTVESVLRIAQGRPGFRAARNALASSVKRRR